LSRLREEKQLKTYSQSWVDTNGAKRIEEGVIWQLMQLSELEMCLTHEETFKWGTTICWARWKEAKWQENLQLKKLNLLSGTFGLGVGIQWKQSCLALERWLTHIGANKEKNIKHCYVIVLSHCT